jgi:hypothetical protein
MMISTRVKPDATGGERNAERADGRKGMADGPEWANEAGGLFPERTQAYWNSPELIHGIAPAEPANWP